MQCHACCDLLFYKQVVKFISYSITQQAMLTKTGELLMRKKNQNTTTNRPSSKPLFPEPLIEFSSRPHKTTSHISHVNQYNFISVSNKSNRELQVSQEVLQQLEVQNFRLIEENMRLVEWAKTFLNKTRQNIMRIIQGIEQFRYLQSVNKLYEVIGELSEYEQNGFQLPRLNTREHYQNLKKLNKPQIKKWEASQLQMRKLQSFTYNPQKSQSKQVKAQEKEQNKQKNGQAVSFLPEKMKADFSDFEPTSEETAIFNMLLLQCLVIEQNIKQNSSNLI